MTYTWDNSGMANVRVKEVDVYGAESEESGPFPINKFHYSTSFFLYFLIFL